MQIPAEAWILVADGKKALFLRNDGEELYPNLHVVRKSVQDNPPSREQGRDKPGMRAGGGVMGAAEPTDWHQIAEDAFAAEVADRLYKMAHADRFEKLILIAPPNTLGELRKCLHPAVSGRVIGEMPKDLTRHPVSDIEQHILSA
jgi:protein required for attachment to host cells